jgi:cytochrome c551
VIFVKRTIITLLSGTLLVSLVLSGCGSKSDSDAGKGKPELLNQASTDIQTVYKKNCLSCHGGGLEGRIGPKTDLTQIGGRLTAEQIDNQIRKGGNGMPAYQDKLNPDQIKSLTDWLSGLK